MDVQICSFTRNNMLFKVVEYSQHEEISLLMYGAVSGFIEDSSGGICVALQYVIKYAGSSSFNIRLNIRQVKYKVCIV